MFDDRSSLKPGTVVTLENGNIYEIAGPPMGSGGGSIIYPAKRLQIEQGQLVPGGMDYALKECFPVSSIHPFYRSESGEILPVSADPASLQYLGRVQEMQIAEKQVTQNIYRTASRLLPILESSRMAQLTCDGTSTLVRNVYTVMESLAAKGQSLASCVEEYGFLTPLQTFHVIRQILFALREIHSAGYLHLDLQGGNIFIKGTLEDESDIITLIDFGSARELRGGKTAPVADRVIFTTQGFSAPEILLHNDSTLQLGPEADLYSVGCLMLFLLTGVRSDPEQLIHNTSGRYLTSFKLRKIDCPRHLIDRMQEIIARALALEPADRYHSAEEMLSDDSDFLKVLRPSGSTLGSVPYDAFICYRHGETDSPAARALQKELEHFRAPRGIRTAGGTSSRKPFRRVFLDEGELSSCADFGSQIREALKNSAWLIVVCSPATPSSPWVSDEIDTFLKYHDRSRILAVLTDGEPEDSFPKQLLAGPRGQTEVLAADARGSGRKDVLKKLRGEALLKLAAPMLDTTYDSLKQRHKVHRLQQLTAAACFVMLIAGAFSVYAVRQNRRIQEELRRTQIMESRYLARQSGELLRSDSRPDAVRAALAALPESSADKSRPVVPEAVYALNNAVYSYRKATPNSFFMKTALDADSPLGGQELAVSPDGSHVAALDGSGKLCLFSSAQEAPLMTARPSDMDPSETCMDFLWTRFLDDTQLLLVTEDRLICWDITSGTRRWSSEFKYEMPGGSMIPDSLSRYNSTGITVSPRTFRIYLASVAYQHVNFYIFNGRDGSLICGKCFDVDSFNRILASTLTPLELSPDETYAAFGVADDLAGTAEEEIPNLFLVSLDTLDLKTHVCAQPNVNSVCFTDNESAAVLSASVPKKDAISSLDLNLQFFDYAVEKLKIADLTPSWDIRGSAAREYGQTFRILPDPAASSASSLLAILGTRLSFIDGDLGKETRSQDFPAKILAAGRFSPQRLIICLSDGSVHQIMQTDGTADTLFTFREASGDYEQACQRALPDCECEFFLKEKNGSHIGILSNIGEDASCTGLELEPYLPSDRSLASSFFAGYYDQGEKTWRMIRTYAHLLLYELGSDQPAADVPVTTLEDTIGFKRHSDDRTLYFVDAGTLSGVDPETSEIVFSCPLPDTDTYSGWSFLGWQGDTAVFRNPLFSSTSSAPQLLLVDTKTAVQTAVGGPEEKARITHAGFQSDSGFIAATTNTYTGYNEDPVPDSLWFYDISSGTWRRSGTVPGLELKTSSFSSFTYDGTMAVSPGGRTLAIVSLGNITVLDHGTDSVRGRLSCSCLKNCRMEFLDEERLAVWDDTMHLSVWNTGDLSMIYRTEEEHVPGSGLFSNSLTVSEKGFLSLSYSDLASSFITAEYKINDDGTLVPHLLLNNELMDHSEQEILYIYLYGGSVHAGYYPVYSLDELIRRAKDMTSRTP